MNTEDAAVQLGIRLGNMLTDCICFADSPEYFAKLQRRVILETNPILKLLLDVAKACGNSVDRHAVRYNKCTCDKCCSIAALREQLKKEHIAL